MAKSKKLVAVTLAVFALHSLALAQKDLPRVFTLDPASVARARASCLAGEPQLQPALKQLLREADKLLAKAPMSVMEKTQVPPSGDKHDYMSLARYYWPDSTKPNGLPYRSRDGVVNPEIYSIADYSNLGNTTSGIFTLALAYYLTDDERYAAHATAFVRSWFLDTATRMNPNFSFAQGVKGLDNGRPAGLIEARGFSEVVDGIGLLARSKSWNVEDQKNLVQWFNEYLNWLLTSTSGTKAAAFTNNIGSWYDVQTGSIAMFVGKPDVARRLVEEAKVRRIASQIEADGKQPLELARTTSQHYVLFNLQAFFTLAAFSAHAGVDLFNFQTDDGRGIRKAFDWVMPYLRGEKDWTYKQIKKFDPAEYYPLLLQAADVYQDQSYADLAMKLKGIDGSADRIHLFLGR